MDGQITLRPFDEQDVPFLDRLSTDPDAAGPFMWTGFTDPRARRRRWERDGYLGTESTAVAVALDDRTVAGIASWEAKPRGGLIGGCYEIGLALLPEYRGRGWGAAAHRLLVAHLFDSTPVHRLEAQTDAENVGERTVLERVGFRCEGVLRGSRFRRGRWRDMVMYGLLRTDLADPPG